jgi:hypothetical protein
VNEFLSGRDLPAGVAPEDFIHRVVEQLAKDFDLDGERLRTARIGVGPLLKDVISAGLEGDPGPVFAAFYRLDLGEERVRQILHDNEREEAARRLAELALQRAALKVWTRLSFR